MTEELPKKTNNVFELRPQEGKQAFLDKMLEVKSGGIICRYVIDGKKHVVLGFPKAVYDHVFRETLGKDMTVGTFAKVDGSLHSLKNMAELKEGLDTFIELEGDED